MMTQLCKTESMVKSLFKADMADHPFDGKSIKIDWERRAVGSLPKEDSIQSFKKWEDSWVKDFRATEKSKTKVFLSNERFENDGHVSF